MSARRVFVALALAFVAGVIYWMLTREQDTPPARADKPSKATERAKPESLPAPKPKPAPAKKAAEDARPRPAPSEEVVMPDEVYDPKRGGLASPPKDPPPETPSKGRE